MVRIRVASHLEGEELTPMTSDPDYFVRQIVAERIGVPQLKYMIDDPDPEVRRVVALRIAPEWLLELADDPDGSVCLAVAERLTPAQLLPSRFHRDFRVRYQAAARVPFGSVAVMCNDDDPLVRERVGERLAAQSCSACGEHAVIEMNVGQQEEGPEMNIASDSDVVELDGPPDFDYGQKVRSMRHVPPLRTGPARVGGNEPI